MCTPISRKSYISKANGDDNSKSREKNNPLSLCFCREFDKKRRQMTTLIFCRQSVCTDLAKIFQIHNVRGGRYISNLVISPCIVSKISNSFQLVCKSRTILTAQATLKRYLTQCLLGRSAPLAN